MNFALRRRACRHFPKHRHNQMGWLNAVAYLRSKNLWLLDGGTPKIVADLPRQS